MSVLKKGMKGEKVNSLQLALVLTEYLAKEAMKTGPGIFGPQTERAVILFQGKKGLTQDGVVGSKTRDELVKSVQICSIKTSVGTLKTMAGLIPGVGYGTAALDLISDCIEQGNMDRIIYNLGKL